MFCIRIMGPMLGFWMGSVFNKLYYDGEGFLRRKMFLYLIIKHLMELLQGDPMWIGEDFSFSFLEYLN